MRHAALLRERAVVGGRRRDLTTLALHALRDRHAAHALWADGRITLRSDAWHRLERELTRWRAVVRDPAAPARAASLTLLVAEAAARLAVRGAPSVAGGRYVRPACGDLFDVRVERLASRGRRLFAVTVHDVTRPVLAEREVAKLRGVLRKLRDAGLLEEARLRAPPGRPSGA